MFRNGIIALIAALFGLICIPDFISVHSPVYLQEHKEEHKCTEEKTEFIHHAHRQVHLKTLTACVAINLPAKQTEPELTDHNFRKPSFFLLYRNLRC